MAGLKQRIIEHLEKKGTYDPSVDDDMVDELIQNMILSKKTFKELKEQGVTIEYITGNGSIMRKMNPTLAAYQVLSRNVYQLARKLGIDRGERIKMKIIETQQQDEFDDLMNT